jgi:ABC-2 type transport system permease protein
MLRSVATKLVRDQRRAIAWWTLGLIALTAFTLLAYPSVRDSPEMNQYMEDLPEAVVALFGNETDLTSPEGYLNSQLFSLMAPLLLAIYAVTLGTGAIAGEEEKRTLDLLLSTPVPRWRVVVEKAVGIVAIVAVLGVGLWLQLWIEALAVDMEIGAGALAAATVASTLLALVLGALALTVGCITGRRGVSLAISSAVGVAAYLVSSLAPLYDGLEPLKRLSPFYWAIGTDPLRDGLSLGGTTALVAVTVALVGAGLVAFERRDVAV